MQPKVRVARLLNIVAALVMSGLMAPRVGWPLVVTCVAMMAIVLIGSYHLDRRERPELWAFYATVVNIQIMLGAGAAVAGGPRTPLVAMASVPVAIVATRFSARGLMSSPATSTISRR